MSVEFDTPAARVIEQFSKKDEFRIPVDLPDIAFLRALSVQGRLRYFVGTTTITPITGETFFLYQVIASPTSGADAGTLSIVNDGRTRASIDLSFAGTSGAGSQIIPIIDSLVGTGNKNLVITFTNATGSIFGWVENTSRIRDVTI